MAYVRGAIWSVVACVELGARQNLALVLANCLAVVKDDRRRIRLGVTIGAGEQPEAGSGEGGRFDGEMLIGF